MWNRTFKGCAMNIRIRGAATTALAIGVALCACAASADSPSYPTKPIRLITHVPPGTSPDVIARIIGERLALAFGQPIVVENRPGANGTIALAAVAKAPPDGYTFGTMTLSHAIAPSLVARIPYDTVHDLAPVRQTTQGSLLLVVRAESPLRSLTELVATAKAQPGQLTYATPGNGSPLHLAAEVFKSRAAVDIRHVPYKGAMAAVTALLGGQVDVLSTSAVTVLAPIRSAKLRAIATTGPARMAGFPEVPTLTELGFADFDVRDWQGFVVPARTPKPVIERLATAVTKVLQQAEIGERIAGMGMEPISDSGPAAFGALIRSELARWTKVVREAGIRAD
jgi:tripartite-type tricarboxylate transporter receptor subunit TctC